jgi:hypothetical protein
MKPGYAEFKSNAFDRFEKDLHEQNAQDAALYRVVVSMLCDDLHRNGMWNHEFVRSYWHDRAPFSPPGCTTT